MRGQSDRDPGGLTAGRRRAQDGARSHWRDRAAAHQPVVGCGPMPHPTDIDRAWTLAPAGPTATGFGHALLAWLCGRGPDTHLWSDLQPPTPPPWPMPPTPGWG